MYDIDPYTPTTISAGSSGSPAVIDPLEALWQNPSAVTARDASGKTVLRLPWVFHSSQPRERDDVLLELGGDFGGHRGLRGGDGEEVVLGDGAFAAAAVERGLQCVL